MAQKRWIYVNRRSLAILFGLVLLSLGLYYGATVYLRQFVLSKEQLFETAMQNTLTSSSMGFTMVVKIGQVVLSDVQGIRVAPDNVKIAGTMQDLPIEFVHIGDKTYIKGYWSDHWVGLEGNKMAESELFVTEFNPLGNFNFKDVPSIKEMKPQNHDGTKCRVLEVRPILQNSFMELNYSDFIYTLWLDPKQKIVTRAQIQATSKNDPPNRLTIDLELFEFNQPMTIEPPKTN